MQLNFTYTPEDLLALEDMANDCKKALLKQRAYCPTGSPREQEITHKISAVNLFLNDLEYTARKGAQ